MTCSVQLGLPSWQVFLLAEVDHLPAVCLAFCLGIGNKRIQRKWVLAVRASNSSGDHDHAMGGREETSRSVLRTRVTSLLPGAVECYM